MEIGSDTEGLLLEQSRRHGAGHRVLCVRACVDCLTLAETRVCSAYPILKMRTPLSVGLSDGGMEPEEEWWEPSDAELEDLIEDRLAEGPLDSEPMTWPPLSFPPIVLVMIGFVLGLLVCSFG